MDEGQAKALEDKLMAKINDLVDFTRPGSDKQRAARAVCYDTIIRRNYMCLGSFETNVEILRTAA